MILLEHWLLNCMTAFFAGFYDVNYVQLLNLKLILAKH